jgi:ubiquinone/menaquinone biosynthesis C-methylase UbiE
MKKERNMPPNNIPETIENQWDIFYRDYPEIYDRFGRVKKQPTAVEMINQNFPLAGKTILDVGSGTGLSTIELARYAHAVIGVEPEVAMRAVAEKSAAEQQISNVRFLEGWAEKLPIEDRSVDLVTAITLASLYTDENIILFAREAERVVRPGGIVLSIDVDSQWYGGELAEIILGMPREQMELTPGEILFPKLGYSCIGFFTTQDYGTVENLVQTYGFIFGKKAIDYIRQHQKTAIQWKFNVQYKQVR